MLYGAWISSSFSGRPDKWLTLLRTTGSVCSGQVAHFETGQVAQFRQESPNVVRFNFDENFSTISKTSDGIVDFLVESDKYKMQVYFEVSLADWKLLFKR